MRASLLIAVCACGGILIACGGPRPDARTTVIPPAPATAKTCNDVKPRVEDLYRTDPVSKRGPDFVGDNTAMVMNDCAKRPELVACLARVATVADLEHQCLIPIDDEGTEGSYLQAKDVSGK